MRALLLVTVLLAVTPRMAQGYGYTREADPLLRSFEEAVRAARAGRIEAARAKLDEVRWQLDELRSGEDLRVDVEPALRRAHGPGASESSVVAAWANLVYLALLQKLHWNVKEQVSDYHKARARLDSAWAYYELVLSGNVRRHDEERRRADPRAPSRHEDIVRRFEAAREALGSPGLFGTGARPPDLAAFRQAAVAIAGHLRAVFPDFVHPGGS